ncbi:hypothetical protein [Streptomyces boninensis]|uniref:hypothetical protein n=1 Tax=Streptomyces boninensis TaxID=2039455 RepID=UPI003B2118FD
MRPPEFTIGDQVLHFREGRNIGTVVDVERRGYVFRRWVYYVQWRPGVDPVPLRDGLKPASSLIGYRGPLNDLDEHGEDATHDDPYVLLEEEDDGTACEFS